MSKALDANDGLATLAVAEQLYDALLTWDTLRAVEVTAISQAFFEQLVPSITRNVPRRVADSQSALAIARVRKAPNARVGLAAGEDDACVLRRAARCWDAVGVAVGVTCLLGSWSHRSVCR
jgi:hypothetical protein